MPTLDLSDEDIQQLTMVLANASGPGISWLTVNALLTKLQTQAQAASQAGKAEVLPPAEHVGNSEDKGYAAVSRPRR